MRIQYPTIYAALIGFLLWALSERIFHILGNNQQDEFRKEDRSFFSISLFWYSVAGVSFIDAYMAQWTISIIDPKPISWSGLIFIIIGLAIRFAARKELGSQYSVRVATSEDHKLITSGIFRVIRHPAYLGLLFLFIGIPLSAWSLPGFLLAVLGGIPALINRIKIEEHALLEWFGADYSKYAAGTWRIIPWIW